VTNADAAVQRHQKLSPRPLSSGVEASACSEKSSGRPGCSEKSLADRQASAKVTTVPLSSVTSLPASQPYSARGSQPPVSSARDRDPSTRDRRCSSLGGRLLSSFRYSFNPARGRSDTTDTEVVNPYSDNALAIAVMHSSEASPGRAFSRLNSKARQSKAKAPAKPPPDAKGTSKRPPPPTGQPPDRRPPENPPAAAAASTRKMSAKV